MDHTHWPTLLVGVSSCAFMAFLKKWKRTAKLPAPLFAIVVYIVVMVVWQAINGWADSPMVGSGAITADGIKIVGKVAAKFPTPVVPDFATAAKLIQTAVFAMFVAFVESLAVAKTYAMANKCAPCCCCCAGAATSC